MPHRVNQWNYTDRGSATCHNDLFRGKGNGTYQASNMRSNQGFASVKTTFPQGSFATCRYPDTPELQRKESENNWHPRFPGVTETPNTLPEVLHRTTGTKELPIPFNKRPGFELEEQKAAEAKHAKYLAFKALQLSAVGGDVIPPDFHEHTIYSATHAATEHKPGQIFRPSRERVGTTPLERAAASKKLEEEQMRASMEGERARREAEEALERQKAWAHEQWRQAAIDPTRPQRTQGRQPEHYNIPNRTLGYAFQQPAAAARF